MKIKWVPLALDDLKDIHEYIAIENKSAAQRTIAVIWEAANCLTSQPHMGRQGRVPGTRELVVAGTPFIIPYRVVSGEVQVLRVLHGARRWPNELS